MQLHWTDITDIAIELAEKHPNVNPLQIRFTDLHNWVIQLEGFQDDPKRGGEKVLEAIQQAWIEEVE
ncbi:MAG: Fe-S assembly protein IscX [Gammaproteobacteria bacterium CG22_combo_CG10-13_8_21_14_all_40_8]|nr:MAG: Fe-S assembly protein IscX [Gammaproteobacteria bacterium CG22_combo_CG10-13_8_21_14_all_40_8]